SRDSPSFFFLRLDQLARKHLQGVLSHLAFGDIARHALHADKRSVLIDGAATDFNGHAPSVFCYDVDFISRLTLLRQFFPEPIAHIPGMFGCDKLLEVMTDYLFS